MNPSDLSQIVNTVLQIDATVIAGILILLTIRSFIFEREGKVSKHIPKPSWVVGLVGTPFAFSAILLLLHLMAVVNPANSKESFDDSGIIFFGMGFTVIGFMYMIWIFFQINMRKKKQKIIKKNWIEKKLEKFEVNQRRKKSKKEIITRYENIFKKPSSRFSQIFAKNNPNSFRNRFK